MCYCCSRRPGRSSTRGFGTTPNRPRKRVVGSISRGCAPAARSARARGKVVRTRKRPLRRAHRLHCMKLCHGPSKRSRNCSRFVRASRSRRCLRPPPANVLLLLAATWTFVNPRFRNDARPPQERVVGSISRGCAPAARSARARGKVVRKGRQGSDPFAVCTISIVSYYATVRVSGQENVLALFDHRSTAGASRRGEATVRRRRPPLASSLGQHPKRAERRPDDCAA